jgi:hypothetical protein
VSGKVERRWTEDEMRRALTYGFCLVCRTPHEVRVTETTSEGRTIRKAEMVKPCGHTEADIDAELERLA